MARQLKFKLSNKEYNLEPVKLDRKKLYGWVDKEVLDGEGTKCIAATLDDTSMKIIPKGDIGFAMLTEEGDWVSRSQLTAVDSDGNPVNLVPSSFDETIELKDTVSIDEYLEHMIKYVYTFAGDEKKELAGLLKDGPVYAITFNYRADYEGTPGFLIESNGEIFLTIGDKIDFEYMAREETAKQLFDVEEEEVEEDEDLDFGMM